MFVQKIKKSWKKPKTGIFAAQKLRKTKVSGKKGLFCSKNRHLQSVKKPFILVADKQKQSRGARENRTGEQVYEPRQKNKLYT